MLGLAFCGNGIIHLNIAEIHEEDIGGQKKSAPIGNQGAKWGNWGFGSASGLKLLKRGKVITRVQSSGFLGSEYSGIPSNSGEDKTGRLNYSYCWLFIIE